MFNNFPYTNFHNLNLDWIVKTVKLLFNKAVFSINGVEPDAEGNVTITGEELGAVGTVNNIAPVAGNVTLTASDVGAVAIGQGVTKVNGISPDNNGNVLAGTVRSVNGISPTSLPTPGNISITASDVGALPSTIDPVETVNGISPDANGNVNVGTVKTVNGSAPDAQGNVNLPTVAGVTSVDGIGPDAQGNVNLGSVYVKTVNGESPVNGNVTLDASDVGALPNSVVPVLKVNNTTPDTYGNVNVGTVSKVNNISPTNGNVTLNASNVNAMSNSRTDGTLEAVSGNTTISGANFWRRCGDVVFFTVQITCAKSGGLSGDNALLTGFPVPQGLGADGMGLTEDLNVFKFHINETGGCTMSHQGNINNGKFALLTGCYTTNS